MYTNKIGQLHTDTGSAFYWDVDENGKCNFVDQDGNIYQDAFDDYCPIKNDNGEIIVSMFDAIKYINNGKNKTNKRK